MEEPMDIDSDFDNKENSFSHSNVLPRTPCTEKGYEELDVSELNMKLRYSLTPASSPMSKSYNLNCTDKLDRGDNANLPIAEPNMIRSLNSTATLINSKAPLQTLSMEPHGDGNISASVLKTIGDNNVTITLDAVHDEDNISLPSTSSLGHTPDATTPTKEDGGSPILRGLKSVLSMFRPSQSPITPTEDKPQSKTITTSETETQKLLASTPISSHKQLSRKSPHKESVSFTDDLEKELQWKDETTIIYGQEKIPIHKLFPEENHLVHNIKNNVKEMLDDTVEYMDVSYNNSVNADRTITENTSKKYLNKNETTLGDSDGEFVDCETTFSKDESLLLKNKTQETNFIEEAKESEKVLEEPHNIPIIKENKIEEGNKTIESNIQLVLEEKLNMKLNKAVKISATNVSNKPNNISAQNQTQEFYIASVEDENTDIATETEESTTKSILTDKSYDMSLNPSCTPDNRAVLVHDELDNNTTIILENIKHIETDKISSNSNMEFLKLVSKVNEVQTKSPNEINELNSTISLNANDQTLSVDQNSTIDILTRIENITREGEKSNNTSTNDSQIEKCEALELENNDSIVNFEANCTDIKPTDVPLPDEDEFDANMASKENIQKNKDLVSMNNENAVIAFEKNQEYEQIPENKELVSLILKNENFVSLNNENYVTICEKNLEYEQIPEDKELASLNIENFVAECLKAHEYEQIPENKELASLNNENYVTVCEKNLEYEQIPEDKELASLNIENVVAECLKAHEYEQIPENKELASLNNKNYVTVCEKNLEYEQIPEDKELASLNIENVAAEFKKNLEYKQIPENKESASINIENVVAECEKNLEYEQIPEDKELASLNIGNVVAEYVKNHENEQIPENKELAFSNIENVVAECETSQKYELIVNDDKKLDRVINSSNNLIMQQVMPPPDIESNYQNPAIYSVKETIHVKIVASDAATHNLTQKTETTTEQDSPIQASKDSRHNINDLSLALDCKNEHSVVIPEHTLSCDLTQQDIESEMKVQESLLNTMMSNKYVETETLEAKEEEIILSENNSPYVSLSAAINESETDQKIIENFEEVENPFDTKSKVLITPPSSPKIVSKGNYNFNFDEIDDPFATKTKIRMSPPSDGIGNNTIDLMEQPIFSDRTIEIKTPHKPKDKRKSQPQKRKSGSLIKGNDKIKTDMCQNFLPVKGENCEIEQTLENQANKGQEMETQVIHDNVEEKNKEINESVIQNIATEQNNDQKNLAKTQFESLDQSSPNNAQSKNVFNIPEIGDSSFNPFNTISKMRQSPIPETIFSNDKVVIRSEVNDSHEDLNCTNSSKVTDGKNVTVREINTEDEDTIEGPFLEADELADLDKMSDVESEKADMIRFSDAHHVAREENAEGEMFIDAEAFEFLLNQNKASMVADSGKESLFLKFDPLFAKRVSSDGVFAGLHKVQKKQSTPKKESKQSPSNSTIMDISSVAGPSNVMDMSYEITSNSTFEERCDEAMSNTITKPTMVVTPAVNSAVSPRNKTITPTRSNRRSFTFTSPAIAVIDRLLSMSANNSILNQDTTVVHYSHDQHEAELALTQLRELLAEKEINVHQLKCESNELKFRLETLESQMKKLEEESQERLQHINSLNEKLAEKTRENKNMAVVVEEYERTIASLITEKEEEKRLREEERMQLIRERDEQTAHLANMECSFNDLHSKYEKSKGIIMTYKANEDACKKSVKDFEENLSKMQSNYELLKQHATSKLNHANQELEKINRAHEADILKLHTMIKRKEVEITSLEESLAQKTKANDELAAICDELINKVG